jgi:hypothetical protein
MGVSHLDGTCDPDTCYSCRVLSVGVMASAFPTRNPIVKRTVEREKQLVRDRTSFKRMSDQGMNPAKMRGAEQLERYAESKHEVETGRILPSQIRERVVEAHDAIKKGEVPNL